MSSSLGCYGDSDAVTPNIDQFANESVRYTHAFASAPVCSPSRSCLIQGCLPPSMGTQHMRSGFPLPNNFKGFPTLLRQRGYYTTNNVKTDYNSGNYQQIIDSSWNDSSSSAHWRNRSDVKKPFFSIFNLMTSHQSRSMVWTEEKFITEVQSKLQKNEIHHPKESPYHPTTQTHLSSVKPWHAFMTA